MSSRVATLVREIFDERGWEPPTAISTTSNSYTFVPADLSTNTINLLRSKGLRVAARQGGLLDVYLPAKKTHLIDDEEIDDEEGFEFDKLISAWRKFAKTSPDSKYRKAARSFKFSSPYNPFHVADQIADATLNISAKSPKLRRLAKFLKFAVKQRDLASVKRILGHLSYNSVRTLPQLKDPNPGLPDISFSVSRSSSRQASIRDALYSSAHRYLLNYIHDNSLGVKDLSSLEVNPGDVFDTWQDMAPYAPRRLYDDVWLEAISDLKTTLMDEGERNDFFDSHDLGADNSVIDDPKISTPGFNAGFATASVFDTVTASKDPLELVEDIIEYYVVDDHGKPCHPEDIKLSQVKAYLKAHDIKESPEKTHTLLKKVVEVAIPRRHDEEEQEDDSAKVSSINLPKGRLIRKKVESVRLF